MSRFTATIRHRDGEERFRFDTLPQLWSYMATGSDDPSSLYGVVIDENKEQDPTEAWSLHTRKHDAG